MKIANCKLSRKQFAICILQFSICNSPFRPIEPRNPPVRSDPCKSVKSVSSAFHSLLICEFLVLRRQSRQQRSRRPQMPVLPLKFTNPRVNILESDCIGVPHRASAVGREAVPENVDDIYIDRSQRDAFLQYSRSFVD